MQHEKNIMNYFTFSSRLIIRLLAASIFLSACQAVSPTSETRSNSINSLPKPKLSDSPKLTAVSRPIVKANKHLVVTANPYASRAGHDILRAGGSAVDAAIAIQMVLNLVEPQSSGIGGGAFLLHFTSKSGDIDAYDGREVAPQGATPDMFQHSNGKSFKFHETIPGGLSVGVPGLLRMLEMAHKKHGKLPWKALFQPAIRLAEDGFSISPRLNKMVLRDRHLKKFKATTQYFFSPNGNAKMIGSRLTNLALAETFRTIAKSGADAFYNGRIAQDIVNAVKSSKINPGRLTMNDMAGYIAKRRDPLCMPYRKWFVCGMPPPTSGGVTTLQILGMLQGVEMASIKPNSIDAVHLITEASRLAYADRNHYIGDPDFLDIPVGRLIDPEYLIGRSKLIKIDRSIGKAASGELDQNLTKKFAPDESLKGKSTSHLTVVDKSGNVVSMTTTIENPFGSHLMVRGFLLNNQLTDFSFNPIKDGKFVANSVWPGKRPRSSMAPTIIFDNAGKPVFALGSPGGSRIIGYVTKSIIAVLDWKMNIQSAFELPHFVNLNSYTDIEQGTPLVKLKPALEQRGHQVRIRSMVSGLHGIAITKEGLEGGVDPRREGLPIGD